MKFDANGNVVLPLDAEDGISVPLTAKKDGSLHLTDPMPFDMLSRHNIEAKDVVLPEGLPPLEQYYALASSEEFTNAFAAKFKAELQAQHISKTDKALELAGQVYTDLYNEQLSSLPKSSIILADSV